MATFLEALGAAVKAATCNSVREFNDSWAANLRERLVPGDVRLFFDTFNCTLCGTCTESDFPPPDFEGGQCDFQYNFDLMGEGPTGTSGSGECLGTQPNSIAGSAWGPISNFRRGNETCSGGPGGGAARYLITCFGPGGAPRLNSPITLDIGGPLYSATLQNVRPANPMNDDGCGDPEPTLPPPGPINVDIDVTFEGDDGDITIPFGLIFAPVYVDLDGSVVVPVRLNGPLFSFDGEVKLFPDFSLEINPPGGSPNGPGETDQPDTEPGEPNLDGEDPPLGPESTIIGVFVRSQLSGRNLTTLIPDSPGPDILAPGVGTVRFAIRAGSLTGWTEDIRVKGVNEFIYCPVPWGAVGVSVRSENGFSNDFTVLRGKPLSSFDP